MVRADSGFFDDKLLRFLKERSLPHIAVARLTTWAKRQAQRVEQWAALDANFAAGEFRLRLFSWQSPRRFVGLRERLGEKRNSPGRKRIDVPDDTFRIFVPNCDDAPEQVWRGYSPRADMENRIAELKHDLGADRCCMQQLHATEAAFRTILLLFNLPSGFQRATGLGGYREPGTIRTQVLVRGTILGHAGRRLVLFMGKSRGGLDTRVSLLNSLLQWQIPTSPKLGPVLQT